MELLVNPTSYKNALNLIKLGVHQICVGFNDLSVRSSCNCTLKEIETLTKQKKTKVNILFNKVYFEPEIENLEKSLKQICKLNIHGVIFADYAVVQICYEQKLHPYLIYHPETLNVNYGQIPFFIKNHINEIVLAREIDVKDLKLIAAHKQSLKTQIQVAGYSYMMDSRWPLVSNFQITNKIKTNLVNKKLYLKEAERKHNFLMIEDNNGTHFMTGYSLCLINRLNALKQIGIDTIRIDSFLHDEAWVNDTVKYYLLALKSKSNDNKQAITNFKKYDKLISEGFYEINRENLIYLKSLEQNNE